MTHDRQCPHPNCTIAIPSERFACAPHWFGLPQAIRASINRAWHYAPTIDDLRAAQAEAIAYWNED